MERRRNRPEKYDRELLHKTVKAVEKVTAVCLPLPPPSQAQDLVLWPE